MKRFLLMLAMAVSAWPAQAQSKQPLALLAPDGTSVTLHVELADTLEKRTKGLMHRKSMDSSQGMLFVWPQADVRFMWMKNTYIPFDMLFIKGGNIMHIHKNARPHDLTSISSHARVDKVLEVPAGFVNRYKVSQSWRLSPMHLRKICAKGRCLDASSPKAEPQ